MKVYKYASPDRFNILENALIRFTQPKYLNDPYDLHPSVKAIFSKEHWEQMFDNINDSLNKGELDEKLGKGYLEKEVYSKLSSEQKEAIPEDFRKQIDDFGIPLGQHLRQINEPKIQQISAFVEDIAHGVQYHFVANGL